SHWNNLFNETSQPCAAVKHCSGFFKSHTDRWQSRGVQPLSTEAFSAYARSAQ
ncbi:His-Xaa-Ser system radical SAM maturase HxsC, partial [Pseudomonas fulva]